MSASESQASAAAAELPPLIRLAQQTFRRELPELLRERPGQWVAYHGEERIALGRSKRELCQECLRRGIAADAFLVCSIEPDAPRDAGDLSDV
jgi:hypothetical protein